MVRRSTVATTISAVLFVIVLVFTFGTTARGELDVRAVTGTREVPPKEFVSLTYSVTNNSGAERKVEFSLNVPDGWSSMGVPSPETIPDGESETVFVTIDVPATAEAGDHSIELVASYDSENYTGATTVTVTEIKEVTVDGPPAKTVSRDTTLRYEFTVKNTGNVTDTFEIEARSGHGWVTSFAPETLDLFPGSSKTVEVELSVPEDAFPGRDPLTVTATSTRDNDIEAEDTVYTRVLPPSPQAVGGELYAVIPARLEGSFDREIGGDEPTGDLTLIADGELGAGDIYMNFGLSDLYTDSLVDWKALDYSEEDYRINTGDVGYTFSDLVSISGRGISANITAENFNLSLIDLSGTLSHGGARLSYEEDTLYLSGNLANLEVGEEEYSLTETLVARYDGEGINQVMLEAGYTPSAQVSGQAYKGYARVGLDPITLEGEGFFIGNGFAGNATGEKGFRLSQSSGGENYSQNLNYAYFFQPKTDGAVESTLLTDRLSANAFLDVLGARGTWPEGREGRAFRLSGYGSMTHRRDVSEEPDLDETTQRFTGSFLYRHENIDFSGSATEELRTNHLSEQTFESFSVDQGFGFDYEGIIFGLEFSHNLTDNLTTEERVSTSGSTTFTLETSGEPFVGLSLTKRATTMSFDLGSTFTPSEDLELSLDAGATIGRGDIDFEGTLDFTYEYDMPLKFLITKGRVEGHVFIDENLNGKRDEGESGVPDLVLDIEGTTVASGEDGLFRFPPFKPGTYELTIEDLPARFEVAEETTKEVEVTKGGETVTEIPLIELASVTVTVFDDSNQNGERNTGEGGLSGVEVTLVGPEYEDSRRTNDEGRINFRGLQPGEYTLTLNKDSLPPRSEVTTDNAELTFQLVGGEEKELDIGSYQRPREIIFGQPPEPDFAFSPTVPKPEKEVNFSGGPSNDPDGDITKYEWDFQSDGKIDQTGKIVSHSFPDTGTYEVSLTVTDNDGNEATITKTIEVKTED